LEKRLNYKNNQILRPAPLYSITAEFSRAKRAKIQGLFAGLPPPVSIIPRLLPLPAFLPSSAKPLCAGPPTNFQASNFNAAPDNGASPPPNEGLVC
jgi:hypothetical protein